MGNYAGMTFEDAQEQEKKDYCFSEPPPPISIQELMRQSWVSVDDRLPEMKVHVLTYCDDHPNMPMTVNYINNYEKQWAYHHTKNITHWMPLPEIPK